MQTGPRRIADNYETAVVEARERIRRWASVRSVHCEVCANLAAAN